MSEYTRDDLSECVGRVALPSPLKSILKAWGESPEGGGSWNGGFVAVLESGQFAYISGWADYTGWG